MKLVDALNAADHMPPVELNIFRKDLETDAVVVSPNGNLTFKRKLHLSDFLVVDDWVVCEADGNA